MANKASSGALRLSGWSKIAKTLLRISPGSSPSLAIALPEEVLLRIFSLLHQRGRFGLDEWSSARKRLYPPTRNVRALARVCRAWHGAAMEVLYSCVWLFSDHSCVCFAGTLTLRPALANLVRRFSLPPSASRLPYLDDNLRMMRTSVQSVSGPKWIDFESAVDRIIALCTHATDVHLFGAASDLERFTGLMECAPRVTSLSLGHSHLSPPKDPEDVKACLPIPGSSVLDPFLPHLEELSLSLYSLGDELSLHSTLQFSRLRILRLVFCIVHPEWLSHVLQHAPNLKTIELRSCIQYSPSLPQQVPSVPHDIFADCAHALERCTIHGLKGGVNFQSGSLASLRFLDISGALLISMQRPPPKLETLIIRGIRAQWDINDNNDMPWRPTRRVVLLFAEFIKIRLPTWKNYARELRAIELWGAFDDTEVETWNVAAFLLGNYLKSFDVALTVNLRWDSWKGEPKFRRRPWRRNFLKNLLPWR
ncbi:hypothetical protein EXIGLDRAFT_831196 [Exidia glandulosa HHB12029]|uniref:F-box domain-containing protein n=1 Tax=Exidia glandulosa HHB12029 TaxID=1314781 RepID=A0A165MVE0_EXIGL|nr:hypothetical protein EXIGLDRAFT_831196 [Exidia glandulosa HHB12029]